MSPIVISPVDLFVMVVLMGAVNVLFSQALTQHLAKKWVKEAIETSANEADFLTATAINCEVFFKDEEGGVLAASKITLTGREVKAQIVQGWLDSRGLVMVPKGRDFEVKKAKV